MKKPKWNNKMGISKKEYSEETPKNPQPKNRARRRARQLDKKAGRKT